MSMGPRTFLVVTGLGVGAVCWATGFAIHGLPAEDWMNWKGWGWIFAPINAAIGAAYAWSIRGSHERQRRFREEIWRQHAAEQRKDVGP